MKVVLASTILFVWVRYSTIVFCLIFITLFRNTEAIGRGKDQGALATNRFPNLVHKFAVPINPALPGPMMIWVAMEIKN